jgi:hypothetical protein
MASQEENQSMSALEQNCHAASGRHAEHDAPRLRHGGLMAASDDGRSAVHQCSDTKHAAGGGGAWPEQEAVRKSLEQLNKEAQAGGEQKNMLGDLDKIAEEMKEVVQNLTQNNVNPETLRKQERILSRLLDASKSMRERDYEKKRSHHRHTGRATRSGELDPHCPRGRKTEDLKSSEHDTKDYQSSSGSY